LIRVDRIFKGNCLGILNINRLAFGQPAVVRVGDFFGAFFRAQTTGDTLVRVYIAGVLDQLDLEIALCTADAFDFGKGEKFDVDMPADLDQFG
jgi:hypothetical protein